MHKVVKFIHSAFRERPPAVGVCSDASLDRWANEVSGLCLVFFILYQFYHQNNGVQFHPAACCNNVLKSASVRIGRIKQITSLSLVCENCTMWCDDVLRPLGSTQLILLPFRQSQSPNMIPPKFEMVFFSCIDLSRLQNDTSMVLRWLYLLTWYILCLAIIGRCVTAMWESL